MSTPYDAGPRPKFLPQAKPAPVRQSDLVNWVIIGILAVACAVAAVALFAPKAVQ